MAKAIAEIDLSENPLDGRGQLLLVIYRHEQTEAAVLQHFTRARLTVGRNHRNSQRQRFRQYQRESLHVRTQDQRRRASNQRIWVFSKTREVNGVGDAQLDRQRGKPLFHGSIPNK